MAPSKWCRLDCPSSRMGVKLHDDLALEHIRTLSDEQDMLARKEYELRKTRLSVIKTLPGISVKTSTPKDAAFTTKRRVEKIAIENRTKPEYRNVINHKYFRLG